MLLPANRYLLLKDKPTVNAQLPEQQHKVLLPEEYVRQRAANPPEHGEYVVVSTSHDCNGKYPVGSHVIVEEYMVKTVDIGGTTHKFVLENHVICIMGDNLPEGKKKVLRG